ncbi:MAG: hypothetical protein OXI56_09535 [bacterium]|nr:hypothetical protein [bacterium]
MGRVKIPFPLDRAEMQNHARSAPTSTSSEQRLLSGIEPDMLLGEAEDLLLGARSFDPLGEWHQIVRAGTPDRWPDLRFDALQAMDWRIAAEMLLFFYEDLADQGLAEPLSEPTEMWGPPRRDRLTMNYLERSRALQRFRLEDAPAVVVVVEGQTEEYMMPRALEWAGMGADTGLVDIVNLKGIDKDVTPIARAVATPKLERQARDRARLLRPLTGLVVAVDQEGRYETDEQQQNQRIRIIKEIWEALPEDFQTSAILENLEHLVVVETWGAGGCFEFAHFTDEELAQAIHRTARKQKQTAPPADKIEQALATHRREKQNIRTVWKNWGWHLSKVELAKETWPILLRKLNSQDHMEIPIGRTLQTVADLIGATSGVTHMRTGDNT